jgi:hypothetical protein
MDNSQTIATDKDKQILRPEGNKVLNRLTYESGQLASKDLCITDLNLEIYTKYISGYSQKQLAEEYQLTPDTICYHVGRCKNALQNINIEEMRKSAQALYPIAHQSLKANLEKQDPKTTISYLKGIQVLVPKIQSDKRVVKVSLKEISVDLGLDDDIIEGEVIDDTDDDSDELPDNQATNSPQIDTPDRPLSD